ncbi:hypothetical protein CHS0354_017105 [Potamilus streckersoni]|uniref:sn-1-specific diacylglycerol lipase ABHD11 n=1 Tax=Potamilus streckersoni TaxID=2493646 RepID=A0AAE0VSL8_9BIVA|nr:hypothetical protein CHS0354_017105 [Potamilus streckersoni]
MTRNISLLKFTLKLFITDIKYASHFRRFENLQICKRTLITGGGIESKRYMPVELAYTSYQETAKETVPGPPIIISHGLLGSKSNWHSISKVLSKTGRQVIAADARNHGESRHVVETSYFRMSDDIIHLMDELEISKATLMGHSMGGKTSMLTAMLKPERVAGLIVVDVSPRQSPVAGSFPAYLEQMLKIGLQIYDKDKNVSLSTARREAMEKLKEVEENVTIREFLATNLIERNNKIQWRVNLDSLITFYSDLCRFPTIDECYTGPTLFLAGENSQHVTESDLPVIEKLFPNCQVQYVEGAGHWVHSEKPLLFLKHVKHFLEETLL